MGLRHPGEFANFIKKNANARGLDRGDRHRWNWLMRKTIELVANQIQWNSLELCDYSLHILTYYCSFCLPISTITSFLNLYFSVQRCLHFDILSCIFIPQVRRFVQNAAPVTCNIATDKCLPPQTGDHWEYKSTKYLHFGPGELCKLLRVSAEAIRWISGGIFRCPLTAFSKSHNARWPNVPRRRRKRSEAM